MQSLCWGKQGIKLKAYYNAKYILAIQQLGSENPSNGYSSHII